MPLKHALLSTYLPLQLTGNRLSGTLPDAWADLAPQASTAPGLVHLAVGLGTLRTAASLFGACC